MSIVAIDAGGDTTKIYDGQRFTRFPSIIGYDWRDRNLQQHPGPYDFDWQYNGQRGFAGTLAQNESECGESRKGDSKAHPDALLRTLIALHQYADGVQHKIVVGQPIGTHTAEEKTLIKEMYLGGDGRHELTVNGIRKTIWITRCEVAAEGVTSGLLVPGNGTIRVIDIGSGTVNFGTLVDRRFNDRGSFTLAKGLGTLRSVDPAAFAHQIATRALAGGWRKNDTLYVCGGGCEAIIEPLHAYFPTARAIDGDPVMANVRAFYLIARRLYGEG